ncbi:MAG TPA: hypothetical protein VIV40_14280 [Kofleriaceae bacterium]
MWIALYVIGSLVGLVILLNLIGLALPRNHLAARRARFAQPPERVWDAMVELADQVAARDKLPIELERDDRPRTRIGRIVDDKLPFGGRWYYELEPVGADTQLTITEAGFVKVPMFRIFTALAPNATKTKFLRELGDKLAVPVTVEPAEPSALAR